MTIRTQVKQQLDDWFAQGTSVGPRQLTIQWPEGSLTAQLLDVQPLGCSLWELEVCTAQTARADTTQLLGAGQRLADRVRYLLEPLQVHEVDGELAAIQLRSSPPQRQERTVWYYEVTAERRGSWRLVRYEKAPSAPRQQVPALVTIEVLARLCEDVVEAACATC
jgi:hypothetical protein